MMRLAAILVLAAGLLGACSGGDGEAKNPFEAEIDGDAPYVTGAEVERTYDYVLYVHCGVEWARIDGAWWQTALLDDGNRNPPDGWGNPFDEGELTIIDDMTATYSGPDGPVEFKRTERTDPPHADCA